MHFINILTSSRHLFVHNCIFKLQKSNYDEFRVFSSSIKFFKRKSSNMLNFIITCFFCKMQVLRTVRYVAVFTYIHDYFYEKLFTLTQQLHNKILQSYVRLHNILFKWEYPICERIVSKFRLL